MSKIRAKNTKPEILLRKALFKKGFRYRIHVKKLSGAPDIVLPKYKTVIFVHGCFWHLHSSCRDGRLPQSRLDYWEPKLLKNVTRDNENQALLKASGWAVIVIWECEINKDLSSVIDRIEKIVTFKKKL